MPELKRRRERKASKANAPGMGLRVALFSPSAVTPTALAGLGRDGLSAQMWIGGVIDRERRRLSPNHPRRAIVLVDVPYADLMTLPSDMWMDFGASPTYEWMLQQTLPGTLNSPSGCGCLIFVAVDIDPAVEQEFNEWNDAEHVPLLLRVPGVRCARRYRALSGHPKYFALYHVATPEVYADPLWLTANTTPWTQRLRRFRLGEIHWIFEPLTH